MAYKIHSEAPEWLPGLEAGEFDSSPPAPTTTQTGLVHRWFFMVNIFDEILLLCVIFMRMGFRLSVAGRSAGQSTTPVDPKGGGRHGQGG
jgi:hypothetical protein